LHDAKKQQGHEKIHIFLRRDKKYFLIYRTKIFFQIDFSGNRKLSLRQEAGERREKVNTADAYANHRFTPVGLVGLVRQKWNIGEQFAEKEFFNLTLRQNEVY